MMSPARTPRRRDREVTDERWIRTMLQHAPVVSIAATDDGVPYVNTNLFVYDGDRNTIAFHTAGSGHLRSVIERNPLVCCSVFSMGRMLPAKAAMDFGVEYASVVVRGRAEIVADETLMMEVFARYFRKYFPAVPAGEYEPFTPADARRATVFSVSIDSWSGKRHQKPEDHPGAFAYTPSIL